MLTDTQAHADTMARMRLLQLSSAALPVGAFAYSQGLEWAVEAGWIVDKASTEQWLNELLLGTFAYQDVPLLKRLYGAITTGDDECVAYWSRYAGATRETQELRDEDRHRAAAFIRLLDNFPIPNPQDLRSAMQHTPLAPYAYAAFHLGLSLHDTSAGHIWSWLENSVTAAIKLVPLGQTEGQQVLLSLSEQVGQVIKCGLDLEDGDIGYSATAMTLASSRHETQYTRLFRS